MRETEREYVIMDRNGNDIMTVRLIDGKTRVFIEKEEVMTCRAIPISLPSSEFSELRELESINDILDRVKILNEVAFPEWEITPELDFFVNCSNLEAWVLHDYDTRLLDYRLSFPLLEMLVERKKEPGFLISKRFIEELDHRYEHGTEAVREYLGERHGRLLKCERLPKAERDALYALQKYWPDEKKYEREYGTEALVSVRVGRRSTITGEVIRDGHVRELTVYSFFEGIPSELSALTYLEKVVFYKIKERAIPGWLVRLPHLQRIEISYSDICGIEGLESGEGTHVKEMDFYKCSIVEFHPSFGNLSSLESLQVRVSKLERLPEMFENLTDLKSLIIEDTEFKELPESFGKLSSLETLKIAPQHGPGEEIKPQLKELPDSFSELKNLKVLDLSYNRLTEFPEQITHLTSLEELNLGSNEIENIPKEIENLKKLKTLKLYANNLHSVPEEIGKLINLESLTLGTNEISYLPDTFGNLVNIKELFLERNKIKTLPDTMKNLKSLWSIYLFENPIEFLPDWLRKLPELQSIDIGYTKISKDKLEEYKKRFHPIRFY